MSAALEIRRSLALANRWAWLPIPVLSAVILGLWLADLRTPYAAPYLLIGLNLVCLTLTSLVVAFLFARTFLVRGALGMMLLGCGAIVFACSVLLAAPGVGIPAANANLAVTIYNVGVWQMSLCYLVGAAVLLRWTSPVGWRPWLLVVGYTLAVVTVGLNVQAARAGWTPVFFVQGVGGTAVRQFVLGSTLIMLLLTAALLWRMPFDRNSFLKWFFLFLLLLAVGLFGVMLQPVFGGALGWVSRAAQYLGGLYLFIGAIAGLGNTDELIADLDHAQDRPWHPYGIAIAAVLIAATLRMVFLWQLETHSPYGTFYVAVMGAALYGGLRAGLLATLISAIIADYHWIEPTGSLDTSGPPDWLTIGLFMAVGVLMSVMAESLHQTHARLRRAEATQRDELERQVCERTAELTREAAERRRIEQGLRESEMKFRAVFESSPVAKVIVDLEDGRIVEANKAWLDLLGFSVEEVIGRTSVELGIWPEATAPEQIYAAIAREQGFRQVEVPLQAKDGSEITALVSGETLELGGKTHLIGVAIDVSERKKSEDRQRLLMREVDHRAKNALAVVQALVRLTKAPTIEAFVEAVQGRVAALARAHSLLARTRWSGASLELLISEEFAAYRHGSSEKIRLSGPPLRIATEAVQPLEIVFHELTTNAAKYGALSVPEGTLDVRWTISEEGDLWLVWRESCGPAVGKPTRRGFGSTMISSAVTTQLGGSIEFHWESQGLRCEFTVAKDWFGRENPEPNSPPSVSDQVALDACLKERRILVVEDEMLTATGTMEDLRRIGCKPVGPAATLEDALRLTASVPDLDAAVVDINLRGRMAWPVADALRKRRVPFLLATGYGDLAKRHDDALILEKPFSVEMLASALRQILKPQAVADVATKL